MKKGIKIGIISLAVLISAFILLSGYNSSKEKLNLEDKIGELYNLAPEKKIYGQDRFICSDTDEADDEEVRGEVTQENYATGEGRSEKDRCEDGELIQVRCFRMKLPGDNVGENTGAKTGEAGSSKLPCTQGTCKDGVCGVFE